MTPAPTAPLVLASSSPRRQALLRQVGIEPDKVVAPDIDESVLKTELPRVYAARMAEAKLRAVQALLGAPPAFVLAADTVVACGRRILPKATTAEEASSCLDLLGGRRHRVYSALAVAGPAGTVRRVVMTMVQMRRPTADEMSRYIACGDWHGKAGGYAIQGMAAMFVKAIGGSYSNVVGLPLMETVLMLEGVGWRAKDPGS